MANPGLVSCPPASYGRSPEPCQDYGLSIARCGLLKETKFQYPFSAQKSIAGKGDQPWGLGWVSSIALPSEPLLSLDLDPPPPADYPVFPPSYTRGLHSRRSGLAHVNECRFYLETWPLVTAPWRISRQTLTNICLEWVCPVFLTQTQETFSTTQDWAVVGWSWSFMLVVQELCPLRMAEDGGGEEAELPECNCDVTRQASPRLSCLCIVSCYVWGWLDGHWRLKYWWVVPRGHGMFVISSSQDAYKWLLGLFSCLLTRHTALAGMLDGLCVGLWCQLSLQCDGGGVGIMVWLMDWESRRAQKETQWIHT